MFSVVCLQLMILQKFNYITFKFSHNILCYILVNKHSNTRLKYILVNKENHSKTFEKRQFGILRYTDVVKIVLLHASLPVSLMIE